ncbi:MAG TPA: hypothetical protein VF160_17145 [Candidatus Dormibacteraeota bacterium]
MNPGYLIHQAERTPSSWEQREIDATNAQIAASFGRLWHAIAAPVHGLRRLYREGDGVRARYHVPAPRRADCG